MMYSRQFGVDLPAGYAGVALREQRRDDSAMQGEKEGEDAYKNAVLAQEDEDALRQESLKGTASGTKTAREQPLYDAPPPYGEHSSYGEHPHSRRESRVRDRRVTEEEELERRYDRRPRYPLYSERQQDPRDGQSERWRDRGESGEEKTGGLLSSLFSLSGKSFSMEDIVLAGLILLLLNEKDGAGKTDNELLLILGLLLMSKKG